MDVKQLQLFIETARRGGFAAVAKDRDLDPSSVSRAVGALEGELGVRLFQRTTRQITLTDEGARYLARVEPLVTELIDAGENIRGSSTKPVGTLRLTASVAFGQTCLVPLLPEFRKRFPGIQIEMVLTDTNVDLVSERIDLAVRLAPRVEGDMVAVKLMPTRYHVCATPDYLRSAPPIDHPEDLSTHRCLLFPLQQYRTRWRFENQEDRVTEVAVQGDVVISNALGLRSCALAGMGPVLLADWLIGADLDQGTLVNLFPKYRVTATEFDTAAWLLYPSRSYLPQKVRVAIDFLKNAMGP